MFTFCHLSFFFFLSVWFWLYKKPLSDIMRIACVICGDIVVPADEISSTPCGHTFHTLCIIQWIERSKSCPQCRQKVTEKSLIKLYFDSGGLDESVSEDPDTLLHQVNCLKFQVRLKETEINKVKESSSELKKQNKGLREELKTVSANLSDKDSTNLALKAQLKYLEQFKIEADKAKETVKKLRQQLSDFQSVEVIVSGTTDDVKSILSSYSSDPSGIKSLATFCALLKKELNKAVEEKKQLRDEASSLRTKSKEIKNMYKDAFSKLNKTEQVNTLLQEDLISLEKENASLQKKVNALQQAVASPSGDVKNSAIHRLIAESPAPAAFKREYHCADEAVEDIAVTPEVVRKKTHLQPSVSMEVMISSSPSELEDAKPRRDVIGFGGRKPLAITTNFSGSRSGHHNIFAKNKPSLKEFGFSQLSSSATSAKGEPSGYDGLGGHHKVDEFPKPRLMACKRKKRTHVKVVTTKGSSSKVHNTITNFFDKTFDDSF